MSLLSNLEQIKEIKKQLYLAVKQINDNIQTSTPFEQYPQMILDSIQTTEE